MEAGESEVPLKAGDETPAEFVGHVAEALRLLYDPSALLRNPLARLLLAPDLSPQQRSRALRALLLEAVEALNPGPGVALRSLSGRSYQALNLHYVQDHTIVEVAHYLALSMRQTYRDLRKGEADLATLLWQRRSSQADPQEHGGAASLRQEVERLQRHPANVSLQEALDYASASLAPLSSEAGVALRLALPEDYIVRADATGLRQCLTALLSYAVQSGAEQVSVEVTQEDEMLWLHFLCDGTGGVESMGGLLATAATLARAIAAELRAAHAAAHARLSLRLPLATSATILVIDDNEGLAQLFQRYLSHRNCTVVGATSPE